MAWHLLFKAPRLGASFPVTVVPTSCRLLSTLLSTPRSLPLIPGVLSLADPPPPAARRVPCRLATPVVLHVGYDIIDALNRCMCPWRATFRPLALDLTGTKLMSNELSVLLCNNVIVLCFCRALETWVATRKLLLWGLVPATCLTALLRLQLSPVSLMLLNM